MGRLVVVLLLGLALLSHVSAKSVYQQNIAKRMGDILEKRVKVTDPYDAVETAEQALQAARDAGLDVKAVKNIAKAAAEAAGLELGEIGDAYERSGIHVPIEQGK